MFKVVKIRLAWLLTLLIALTGLPSPASAQVNEQSVREKIISNIATNNRKEISADKVREAMADIVNYSAKMSPVLKMAQLRQGKADTSRLVQIEEGVRSGIFRYDPTDLNTPDDSAIVVRFGNRRYKRVYEGPINVKWFGAVGDGITNDQPALQKAANYIATRMGKMHPVLTNNALHFPPGTYRMDTTFKTSLATKIQTIGQVTWLFRGGGVSWWIYNNAQVSPDYYKEMYTRGGIVDAQGGNFNIFHYDFFYKDPGAPTINYDTSIPRSRIKLGTTGILIKTEPGRLTPRYKLNDIGIAGFENGIEFDCFQNYMSTFRDLHIEGNINSVKLTSIDGYSQNSGENITFDKCLFAGADNVFLVQGSNIDMVFNECSFDFVEDVFHIDVVNKGFFTVRQNSCYYERVTAAYVNNQASGAGNYQSPSFHFNNCLTLNGRAQGFKGAGAGTLLYFDRWDFRCDNGTHETNGREGWNSQDPELAFLVPLGQGFSIRKKDVFQGLAIPPLVRDDVNSVYPLWNFTNAVATGALGSSNIYFTNQTFDKISSRAIVADGRNGGKALKLTSTAGESGVIDFKTVQHIPVALGDRYTLACIYKVKVEAGSNDFTLADRYYVEEFNEYKELINTTTVNIQQNTFEDDKWRISRWGQEIRISNPQTKFVRFHFNTTGWVGELYLDRIIIDKR